MLTLTLDSEFNKQNNIN